MNDIDIKILLNEFRKRETFVSSMPSVFSVESVLGCPYTCAMCKHTPASKPNKISKQLLNKIEPYYKFLEMLVINDFGEPLFGDLGYFTDQSNKHDFILGMTTTGFFLNKEKIDILSNCKRLFMNFSIHAGKKETYKNIMGGDFEKVLKNVSSLVNECERKKSNYDLRFHYIVMKDNIDEIDDFLHCAHECGVKKVRFMKLHVNSIFPKKMPNRDYTFNYIQQGNKNIIKKFKERLPDYKELCNKLEITIDKGSIDHKHTPYTTSIINSLSKKLTGSSIFPILQKSGICKTPWFSQLIIKQSGIVNLCCSTKCHIGNINNSTLEEIWNSKKMQMIRHSFKNGKYPRVCGYCKGFNFSEYPSNSKFRNLSLSS